MVAEDEQKSSVAGRQVMLVGVVLIGTGLLFAIADFMDAFNGAGVLGLGASVFGSVVGGVGRSLARGRPLSGVEHRETSLVIVVLFALLLVPLDVGAVAILHDNLARASVFRWAASGVFFLVCLSATWLIVGNLLQRVWRRLSAG